MLNLTNARHRNQLWVLATVVLLCHTLGSWRFGRLVLSLLAGHAIGMACRIQRLPKTDQEQGVK